jgi:hypothetical protein
LLNSKVSGSSYFYEIDWLFQPCIILICIVSFQYSLLEGICNPDFHHPGLMLSPALDLKHGLKPFKDIAILYGYLTTYLQSLSLYLLGENLLAIWILTGLFHSISLYLSHRVLRSFLSPLLAFVAAFSIFLLHPYVIYPWSNYYSYLFNLAALFFIVKTLPIDDATHKMMANSPRLNRRDCLFSCLTGTSVALAILCRYSSILAIVMPGLIFFGTEWLTSTRALRHRLIRQGVFVLLGALIPFFVFSTYCLSLGIWHDFIVQNEIVSQGWRSTMLGMLGYRDGSVTLFFISRLLENILSPFHAVTRDIRLLAFSVNFFIVAGLIIAYILLKFKRKARTSWFSSSFFDLNNLDRIVFLISLYSVFGYSNSIHFYESFRLANGASIGVGATVYLLFVKLMQLLDSRQVIRRIYTSGLISLSLCLSIVFTSTLIPLHVFNYWRGAMTRRQDNQVPSTVFAHTIMPPDVEAYYKQVAELLLQFDSSFVIVNNTNNTLLNIVSDKPKAYLMPAFLDANFQQSIGDVERGINAIHSGKAIMISHCYFDGFGDYRQVLGLKIFSIPVDYHEILRLRTPGMPLEYPAAFTSIMVKRIRP